MGRCNLLVRAQQFRRMTSTGDRWAAFLKGARAWRSSAPHGCGLCKATLGKLACAQSQRLRECSAAALEADPGAEVPVLPAEVLALQCGLEAGDIEPGHDERAAQEVMHRESQHCPRLEAVMWELDVEEVEKLEPARRARRKALAEKQTLAVKQGTFRDSETEALLRVAIPVLKDFLVERPRQLAPYCSHGKYDTFVQSSEFDRRLLQEVALVGGLPADTEAEDGLHAWLVQLVGRKDVDLLGMAVNAADPAGFARGHGSMRGNNCFISSVAQALIWSSHCG